MLLSRRISVCSESKPSRASSSICFGGKKPIIIGSAHSVWCYGFAECILELTVRNEFRLKSKYFNCDKSLNVAGGTEFIPFRLRSSTWRAFKFSKWDDSNFWIIFDDKFNNLRLPTSCSAIVGNAEKKFSDKSNFSSVEAPCKWSKNGKKMWKPQFSMCSNDPSKCTSKTSLFSWTKRFPAK